MNDETGSVAEEYAREYASNSNERYLLRLYVTGTTGRSTLAISNIKKVCEEHLAGRYELEVIDLYQHPEMAKGEQLIAAPTLIKKLPLPLRRLIGNMSNQDRVLAGLDILPVH